jgi:hypothetical protein
MAIALSTIIIVSAISWCCVEGPSLCLKSAKLKTYEQGNAGWANTIEEKV